MHRSPDARRGDRSDRMGVNADIKLADGHRSVRQLLAFRDEQCAATLLGVAVAEEERYTSDRKRVKDFFNG